jgi:ribonuclease-3
MGELSGWLRRLFGGAARTGERAAEEESAVEAPPEEPREYGDLEERLGYRFRDPSRLRHAMTHSSYAHEQDDETIHSNQVLEFLGDAILDFLIADLLIEAHPDYVEGDLTSHRATLVNDVFLAERARELNLGRYLLLGRGEELTGGRGKDRILADAFEALVAAIYYDGGMEAVRGVIRRQFERFLATKRVERARRDYKSALQEKTQSLFASTPRYRVIEEKGPNHRKLFHVEAILGDLVLGDGWGSSKKAAEQQAARMGLERIAERVKGEDEEEASTNREE